MVVVRSTTCTAAALVLLGVLSFALTGGCGGTKDNAPSTAPSTTPASVPDGAGKPEVLLFTQPG